MLAAALVVYALARRGWRSAALFLCGGAVPALALLAYNRWAFGSFTHFSYKAAVIVAGNSGHDVIGANDAGFFGITWPNASALALLLFSPRGLLTLTPVCLLGAIGVVLLRRRFPGEAMLAGAVVVIFLAYNAGYRLSSAVLRRRLAGPAFRSRYCPSSIFPVGLAARALPGVTAALLGTSAAAMVLATVTEPMVGAHETGRWLTDLRHGQFTHTVVATLGGGVRWLPMAPFVLLCVMLAGIGIRHAVAGTPDRTRTAFEATCAVVAWLLVLYGSSMFYEHQRNALGLLLFALAAVMGATAIWAALATSTIADGSAPRRHSWELSG